MGAARDRHRIRFVCHMHDGAASVRDAKPHQFVVWGRRWYLLAWDTNRDDWRTFRVDRMAPKRLPGPRFTPRRVPGGAAAAFVRAEVARD